MIAALFEIITVGLPFCAFKIIAGIGLSQIWLTAWGAIDLTMNAVNLIWVIVRRERLVDVCLLALILRVIRKPLRDEQSGWQNLGKSADVLFSFLLVALMLGGGFLGTLAPAQLKLWNMSVILNVLGAGSSRLSASISSLRHH